MGNWALPFNLGRNLNTASPGKRPKDSILNAWADCSALWGSRHGIGEAIDRYMGLHVPLGSTSTRANRLASLGVDDFGSKGQAPLTFSRIKAGYPTCTLERADLGAFSESNKS
jgi:hypothetical protein